MTIPTSTSCALFAQGGPLALYGVAAREADIVGLVPKARPGGGLDWAGTYDSILDDQVSWVREAAGERFAQLEFDVIGHAVHVTDDRAWAAEQVVLRHLYGADAEGLTVEQVLSPRLPPGHSSAD